MRACVSEHRQTLSQHALTRSLEVKSLTCTLQEFMTWLYGVARAVVMARAFPDPLTSVPVLTSCVFALLTESCVAPFARVVIR